MNETIQTIAVYALPILFAITLHEAAHAYAARYFGDLTAYSQGRMSLNPVKHIDPIGTIAIPLVLALMSSPFLFGYAKPVPVDFSRLNNPKRDMRWVALAGPGASTSERAAATLHAGKPVLAGTKYIVTKWFREKFWI
mgnify:CR=1 FL=1